jgi:hypothetical protein
MNAVVTVTIGKNYEHIASFTHSSIRAYANKIGAEFIVLDKIKLSKTSPHYEKFQLYYLLNTYERIIFIDTDCIVRSDCPDLFKIVPEHMIGLVNEGRYQDRSQQMMETYKLYGGDFSKYDLTRYYNSGIMVVSRAHKELFVKPNTETIWNFYEQSYLNLKIQQMELRVFDLEYKFNRVNIMDKFYGEDRIISYIIHYAGVLAGLDEIIPNDLSRWMSGEHLKRKRKVIIGVGAKLGDNICAEPIIRHIVEKSQNTKFVVATSHPDIFKHLDVEVTDSFDMGKEPCVVFNTTLDEKDPRKMFLTADYMHIVDYISLLCLKKQLLDNDKRIKLKVDIKGLHEVIEIYHQPRGLILVHPGKSWPSKTFPLEYWNKIISGIVSKGYHVGIIGNYVDDKIGVLDIDVNHELIHDFRNLLSLKGLIAIISEAPVLVSNDSAPIHVAGAFDNHIIVIPTCKHPDLILPYRHGKKYFKVSALYKRLMCDDVPFDQSNLHNFNMVEVNDIYKYLPDPEVVMQEAISIYQSNNKINPTGPTGPVGVIG